MKTVQIAGPGGTREIVLQVPDQMVVREVTDPDSRFNLEVLMDRKDLIRMMDFILEGVTDADTIRRMMNRCIDSCYFSESEIEERLKLEGEALWKETALHILQALININSAKGR